MRNFAFLAATAAMCSMTHHLAATAGDHRQRMTRHLGDDLGSGHILQASNGFEGGGAGGSDGFADMTTAAMTRHDTGQHGTMTSIDSGGGFTSAGSGNDDSPAGHVDDMDITAAGSATNLGGADDSGQSTR